MNFEQTVARALHPHLEEHLSLEEIEQLLEKPKSQEHGDVAFPTFQLAKIYKKAPQEIAQNLEEQIEDSHIEKIESVGPYLNFFLKRELFYYTIVNKVMQEKEDFGNENVGEGESVPIDMSSPNIAKPMSMGHLRSTVIGNALANIYEKMGFAPIRINHLGDWGTQFGKLITAYKKWGDEETVRENPITELNRLYVHFHDVADEEPELEDEAREWFRRLEKGDEEAYELWKWFREESLKSFNEVYERLHISFDSYKGEAFYNDKMGEVVEILDDKGILVEDEGAMVVPLEEYDLNPALIQKQDGATLYMTRDLAAALYRKREYDFAVSLYVVGQDQKYHFRQLKAVLDKMDYDWAEDIYHIAFGLISVDGEKMSTRSGRVVLLEDVLDEAVTKAYQQIDEKNPALENKQEVAEKVGIGAVIFNDLHNDRQNDFDFDLDAIVQFEGETGPYVQYSRARAMSILEKAEEQDITISFDEGDNLSDDYSWSLLQDIEEFSYVLERALANNEPSIIARHVMKLATDFNKFYANIRVLEEHPERSQRLALVEAVTILIKEELRILGVAAPDEM